MLQNTRQKLRWTKHSQELIWGLWQEDNYLRAKVEMLGLEYKLVIYEKYLSVAINGPYLFDRLDLAKAKAEEIIQEEKADKWRLTR